MSFKYFKVTSFRSRSYFQKVTMQDFAFPNVQLMEIQLD